MTQNVKQPFVQKLGPLIVIIIINRVIRKLTQNQSMQQHIQTVSHEIQVNIQLNTKQTISNMSRSQ